MISMLTNFIKNKKKKEKTELAIEELKKSLLEDPKFRDEILRELEYRTGRRDFLKVGVLGLLGLSAVNSGVYAQNVSSANIDENVIREIVSDYVRDYADSIKIPKPCTVVVAQDGTGDYDVSPGEDASEVIQKAIDDAHKKGGGEVRIREGEYHISSEILLKNNLIILGSGFSTVIKLGLNTDSYIFRNSDINNGNMNIHISNIMLDGNYKKMNNGLKPLIEMVNTNGIILENLYIINSANFAVHIRRSDNVIIQKIRIENNGMHRDGIKLNGVQNAMVSDCIINSGDDCISVTAQDRTPKHIVIFGNTCKSNYARGILINHADIGSNVPIMDIVIKGNTIYETRGVGICIYSNGTDKPFYNIEISNNVIRDTKRNAIACLGSPSAKIVNLIISNNIIKNSLGRGVYVINAEKVSIVGNIVEGAQADQGILIGEPNNPCSNFIIIGNIVDGKDGRTAWGIHVSASCDGIIIGNTIRNCNQGIRGTGNSSNPCLNIICMGNHCHVVNSTQSYGIKTAGNTDGWIIIGNHIKNAKIPIMLAGTNNIVSNNLMDEISKNTTKNVE